MGRDKIDKYINQIIQGDCLKAMKEFPDKSVDLVLTDPPYNIGKDYGNNSDKQLESVYLSWINKIQKETKRIIKSDKISLWFFSIKHLPYIYKQFTDWNYIWTACWIAFNKRSLSINGYNLWQPILIYGSKKWIKNRDVYKYPTGQEKVGHPTPKPLKLIKQLINEYSNENDLILDPFAGSGTTLVACKQLNRRYIGIEINKKYVEICKQRLSQGVIWEEIK